MIRLVNCPTCGAKDTMTKIPKHRNGIQGKQCGMCKEITFRHVKEYDHGNSSSKGVVEEWSDHPSGNMDLKEFEGLE